MSSANENLKKEKSLVFETILSSPGMNEKCKVALVLSRQTILLFCRLIEHGLLSENSSLNDDILKAFSKENLEELKVVHEEILRKGNLADFYEKLKRL